MRFTFLHKKRALHRCRAQRFCRQLATLPPDRSGSTIAAGGLNCRVRDGNGWIPSAIITGKLCGWFTSNERRSAALLPSCLLSVLEYAYVGIWAAALHTLLLKRSQIRCQLIC